MIRRNRRWDTNRNSFRQSLCQILLGLQKSNQLFSDSHCNLAWLDYCFAIDPLLNSENSYSLIAWSQIVYFAEILSFISLNRKEIDLSLFPFIRQFLLTCLILIIDSVIFKKLFPFSSVTTCSGLAPLPVAADGRHGHDWLQIRIVWWIDHCRMVQKRCPSDSKRASYSNE